MLTRFVLLAISLASGAQQASNHGTEIHVDVLNNPGQFVALPTAFPGFYSLAHYRDGTFGITAFDDWGGSRKLNSIDLVLRTEILAVVAYGNPFDYRVGPINDSIMVTENVCFPDPTLEPCYDPASVPAGMLVQVYSYGNGWLMLPPFTTHSFYVRDAILETHRTITSDGPYPFSWGFDGFLGSDALALVARHYVIPHSMIWPSGGISYFLASGVTRTLTVAYNYTMVGQRSIRGDAASMRMHDGMYLA